MGIRADVQVAQTTGLVEFNGGGTQYLVKTPTGVLYCMFCDNGSDLAFKKSTDNGLTWSAATIIFTGTLIAHAIWYDRWSNISAGLIHCAYTESGGSDVLYRNIDTEAADAMSTQTTVFAGASTAAGGALTLTRAIGGNLACRGCIDNGVEPFFFTSVDVGANWVSKNITGLTAPATQDQYLMLPGWNADTQDVQCFFWDASGNAILCQRFDDSGNTWAETSLFSPAIDVLATVSFAHYAGTVDITNSRNVVMAWNGIDTANADLRCFTVDDTTITEVTNVVLNSADDQGLAGLGIDTTTNYWYAFYAGKSDGSETVGTAVNVYYKVSMDAGTTWGAETQLTTDARNIKWLVGIPRFTMPFAVLFHIDDAIDEIRCNGSTRSATASSLIGI